MDEICRSNIMQRDNKKFARKLDKSLTKLAKEKNKAVRYLVGGLETCKQDSSWVSEQGIANSAFNFCLKR